jgi:integrase
MSNSSRKYVTGKRGSFEIQAPIAHPAWCPCAKCAELPEIERALPHTFRIRRASKYPDSKKDSATYAREIIAQEEQRLRALVEAKGRPSVLTLEGLIETYFELNPRKVSAATIARDRISARNLLRIIGKNTLPEKIDEPIALRYRERREKEGARPRTILNEFVFLLGILKKGVEWESITGMSRLRLHKVPKVDDWESDGVALTREEFKKVLAVVSPIDRRRMIVGVTTMLRRKPLFSFQREWVDFERAWLKVPAEVMKKGRAQRRYALHVPIAEWALEQVRDLTPNEHGLVWPSRQTGGVLTRVHDIFVDAVEASGVRPFSCHDLRTTGATWLRDAGVDELVIALLLGHRSTFDPVAGSFHAPSTNVTRSYTRVYETALREAVAVFDAIGADIDPPTPQEETDERFESGIESLESRAGAKLLAGQGIHLVAHTGFEPVLPP